MDMNKDLSNGGGFYDAEPSSVFRSNTAGLAPMGATWGDPSPVWPLPGARAVAGAQHICPRTDLEHVGVDLPAVSGILVVAPEEAIVTRADHPWQGEARAMVLHTHTGLLLLLGGFVPGSHRRLGVRDGALVRKGDPLGRIGPFGALHFEVHDGRNQSLPVRWWRGEPPPMGIFDPSSYLARMIHQRPRRRQPTTAELLLQWRLLQSRRGEYVRLAADSGAASTAEAAALLRADVKAFIDRLRPPRDAADSFIQAAPAGWREQMELLLDADPLVPDLIARSEVQHA